MIISVGSITKEINRPVIEDMILQLVQGEDLARKGDLVESLQELKLVYKELGHIIDRMEARRRR